jgi:iron complex transport system ATP-binding protein
VAAVTAALELAEIAVTLDGRPVLDGVDLVLGRGEVLGLVGRNGAGKTTLLRVASAALRPRAGRVLLFGRPAAAIPRRERARLLALVPQETIIPFAFRALEVVLMGRAPHLGWLGFESAADLRAAREALASLGIGALEDRSVLELSAGERQLVVVARALAQEPSLLLLDEPTAFLDLEHRLRLLGLLRGFAARGGSVLLVSHDLALAARHCQRIALLAGGRIVAAGPPVEVLRPEAVRRVFGVDADVLVGPDGVPLVIPRC